ncbi:MAG: tetratricopeptide repeat protein [Thermoguttaceae bacterium]
MEYVSLKPHYWAPAGAAILALAVFVAYFPSLDGGFIWDDETLLTKNLLINTSGGLHRIWCTTDPVDYWPLINTSFWIEWRLWDLGSTGYHVTNLILHIAASLLIWTILRKLSIPGAFLAALIFALHPVNVESVAWIAQRKNTLCMLFFLMSILWYIQFDELVRPWLAAKQFTTHRPPSTAHCFLWYWLSLAAFVWAMLSKGSAAVLPALVLGIIWWRRKLTRRDFLRTAPFFAIAVALTLVNIWFQRNDVGEVIRDAGFLERLLGAGALVWFYLYKALLPLNLIFIYPQWTIQTDHLIWWLPLFAAVVVTAVLWRYRKGWSRPLLFAWGFFCVSLVPVMGLTDVYFMKYSLVADHYQYAAIIGVIALLAAAWNTWQKQAKWPARRASILIPAMAAVALTSLTWQQSGLFRDAMTLYQATLEKNPNCWMAHNNLGLILEGKGNLQEAMDHYNQSILLNPNHAEAHNNLGGILLKSGQLPGAIAQYEQALQCKQNYAEAHNNLGLVLLNMGRLPEAMEHYEQALRLKPSYAAAQNNLGEAMARTGRPAEAIKDYEKALALQPDFPEAQYNLGLLLLQTGRPREAIKYFEQSIRLKPDYFVTHNNLGTALLRTGRLEEAIEQYKQTLKIKPDYIEAYANLTSACIKANRPAEAVGFARKGLEFARSKGQTAQANQFEDLLKALGN